MKNIKISIQNLSKTFGSHLVLDNINLDIYDGESIAIIGGSGEGKSVLFKCILGLVLPDTGSKILINKHDFSQIHISKRNRRKKNTLKVGVLFQGNALFDSLNIWENIMFEPLLHNKVSRKKAKEVAMEQIRMVELDERIAELYPSEISGGMQKRVALARSIASSPELLFLDEPTSGLDPDTSSKIHHLIRKITSDFKITTITITHDLTAVKIIADRMVQLEGSKLIV